MTEFFVPGVPVPQPRPRVLVRATGTHTVSNSRRVKAFKDHVAMVARTAHRGKPLEGPVWLALLFLMPRPARLKGAPRAWHTCVPDIDNLAKAVLDAVKGVVWGDDGQVCFLEIGKRYAARGEQPGVHVRAVPGEE